MAQKRMFDKAIVDMEKFMDLPLSGKALYFLLGMEADDEGFVSPRKIQKLHGTSEDDLRLLIAKEFLIPFQSGVVVITNWHQNNWLDQRRIKLTQYQNERKEIVLTKAGKYVLSTRLAAAKLEESRIEENSRKIEDKKLEHTRKKLKEIGQSLFSDEGRKEQ